VHRVVITAVLLAAKFFDDAYYNNAYYAKVGGVLVSEMNGLEVDFLFRINFSLHVTPDLFQKYREELLSHSNPEPVPTAVALPPALPIAMPMAAAPIMTGGMMHHHNHHPQHAEMDGVESTRTADHQPYAEKRQATYITPSPPTESARAENTADGGLGLDNPYLQRANTMPPYNPTTTRRCSPQPMFQGARSEPYFMDSNTITYPIHHGTLVHHNHAAATTATKHGFHNPPHHHQEPSYNSGDQYFMGGAPTTAHMLTGCSGGS
jgi:hypothetical protein